MGVISVAESKIQGPETMTSAQATDYIGAASFDVTVYKLGRIALCSYAIQYSSTITAGTRAMKLPYNPVSSILVTMSDISNGLDKVVNISANGELTLYNDFRANDWLEGSFMYFTE